MRRRTRATSAAPPPAPAGGNLLDRRPVAALLGSRWYPGVFQWLGALVFALIMWQLLLGPEAAHENLGSALVWVLWWPLLPLLFIALGRFWCAVCPFGWLSDLVQRIVGLHRRAPRFLRRYGIWMIDAVFVLVTWGDHVWGVVESPWGSGLLLLMTATAVIASGAFFERRTFCRYLCFLGGVAGNYGRTGIVALRARPEVCATCTSRAACYNGTDRAPGCPMFEFPRTMDSSASCNLCAACVKNCPNGALTLEVRPPTKELWFIRSPRIEAAFLAVAIMGIVFVQNITMLDVWAGIESWLQRTTGTTSDAVIYTIVFAVAIAVPALLLLGAATLSGRTTGESAVRGFARFGYALIPLDVSAHLAHNLFHLLAEGKSIVYTGLTLLGVPHDDSSAALVGSGTIQALQFGLLGLGLAGSLYTARRIARRNDATAAARSWPTVAPYAVLLVALAVVNVVLFTLPMAHRM